MTTNAVNPDAPLQEAISLQVLDENHADNPEFSLPQADGGKDAWLFLAACFVCEAMVWGFAFSFGSFQNYYSTHEPFSAESGGVTTIGTTATGIMYMIGLVLFPALKQWTHLAAISKWTGLPIIALSLILASFATTVTQMILTQGVLYAIGGSLLYCPTLAYVDEWFIQRRGLAFGIMWAGSGAAGVIIPFLMNFLLENCVFRSALRIWTVINVVAAPLVYFIRPRLPIAPAHTLPRYGPGLGFLKTSTFWLLQMGPILESLGYFIPSIYLQAFTSSLGLDSSIGTFMAALVNPVSVLSTVLLGMLIDRFLVTTFIAGGFTSTNAGVIKLIESNDERADVGMLLGLLSAGGGIGANVSRPLSEAMLSGITEKGEVGFGYGSGYGSLIVFTGVTAITGGSSFVGKQFGWMN